jgi:arylsulfatase A-like enzyme
MIRSKLGWIAVLALVAQVGACSGESGGNDKSDPGDQTPTETLPAFKGHVPKNLLIISIDTFRRDHLGKYSTLGLTPFMGQLMSEGYTLDNHMTCANWTFPGTACNMNGRLNEENGFQPELSGLHMPMPDGPMLPTWLSPLGFYSIMVTGNSWFSDEWNMNQGFDETELTGGTAVNIYGEGQTRLSDALLRGAVDDRWYLHIHLMEPHAPYVPPDEYLACESALDPIPWDLSLKDDHYAAGSAYPTLDATGKANLKAHMECRYGGELRYLDDQMRTIWADLTARGMLDDTLVAVWDDHGEQMWEHGSQTHAHQLYAEENNGFLFFWAQNIIPGSTTSPTSSIDLVPTLLALYGQTEMPPEVTGIPLGQAPEDRQRYGLTSARNSTISSMRYGDYKIIYNWVGGKVEVYDDATDPGETVDLFDPGDPNTLDLWNRLLPEIVLAQPSIVDDVPSWPPTLPQPGESGS